MNTLFTRSVQKTLKLGFHFLNWREPELITGEHSLDDLPQLLKRKGHQKILIITDQGIEDTGILDSFIENVDKTSVQYAVFDQVEPNPSVEIIEQIAMAYKKNYSQAMVAVGGGSVIDAAKAAGIIVNKAEKNLQNYEGLLKVFHDIPPLFAAPTTAGTGSEATLASVVSAPDKNRKYAIMDTHLIPDYAILDPKLTQSLPPHLTAETGMDALTHAVEAYIGSSNTKKTKAYAEKTVELVDNYLYRSYLDGGNTTFRKQMLKASYYAGVSFTRAYVGNVHAISHALTAFYGVPHGRTNATVLPIVLRIYGESAEKKLSELAEQIDLPAINDSKEEKAELFIKWIEELNKKMDIPASIPEIKEEDMEGIAEHAEAEANPLYPVPQIFSKEDFVKALKIIKE